MSHVTVTGIPESAYDFYVELAANNSRAWWSEHRADYERLVRGPLLELSSALSAEFGEGHLYRPYRDTRFAKDKTPLKDHQGMFAGVEDGVGYYLQVSAAGLMAAGGWYAAEGQQVARFREAVEAGHAAHVRSMIASLERQGWRVDGNPLKTRPRGIDPDHPDLDLLRMRRVIAVKEHGIAAWASTPKLLAQVRRDWRQLAPLVEWLGDHVGPARDPALLPPDETG